MYQTRIARLLLILTVLSLFVPLLSIPSVAAIAADASPYKLPWMGEGTEEVVQGNYRPSPSGGCSSGCTTHHGGSRMEYAWDFAMVEGTPVLASRAGKITFLQDRWPADHCGDVKPINNPPPGFVVDADIANQANYIVIDHGDGTSALYLHLSQIPDAVKAKARAQQPVAQGEEIGLSGKTGWTVCFPHLHFQVQASGSSWFTQSRSITFADPSVRQQNPDGIPAQARTYVSDNGTSTQRATNAAPTPDLRIAVTQAPSASLSTPKPTQSMSEGWAWTEGSFFSYSPFPIDWKFTLNGVAGPARVLVDGKTVVDTAGECRTLGSIKLGFGDHIYRIGHPIGSPEPQIAFNPTLQPVACAAAPIATQAPASTSPPVVAPTIAATATATPVPLPTASFQNVSFSYDPVLAKGVSGATVPADTPAEIPRLAYPQHIRFAFAGYPIDTPNFPPLEVQVYPLREYTAISSRARQDSDNLRILLAGRPDLAALYSPPYIGDLRLANPPPSPPLLPDLNFEVYFVAKPQYVAFRGGAGIRYITLGVQQQYPLTQSSPTQFFYTYQGLTSDGNFYVAAFFPVSVSVALDPVPADITNVDVISAHNERVVGQLERAENDKYTPNLAMLDALIQSMEVATPPTQAAIASPTPAQVPTVVAAASGQLAYITPEGDLAVANTSGTQVRKIVSGPVAGPVWSRDGTKIAYLRRVKQRFASQIEVVNADGGGRNVVVPEQVNPRDVDHAPQAYVRVRWGDQDTALYYGYSYGNSGGHGIIRHDLKTGAERDMQIYAWDFDLARDGAILAGFYDNSIGTTRITLHLPDGTERPIASGRVVQTSGGATVYSVDYPIWSPDGNRIAYLASDGIRIAGRDGKVLNTLPVSGTSAGSLSWSADGTAVFYSAKADNGDIALFRVNLSGGKAQRLFRGSDPSPH